MKVDQECSGAMDLVAFLNFFLVTSHDQLQVNRPRNNVHIFAKTGIKLQITWYIGPFIMHAGMLFNVPRAALLMTWRAHTHKHTDTH